VPECTAVWWGTYHTQASVRVGLLTLCVSVCEDAAMQVTITRENWRTEVEARGITLRGVALATGSSVRSVYAYAQGTRRPSDAWVSKVAEVIRCLDEVSA
jgi:hypothetical protein